jgi:hypothetical protein
MILGLTLKGTFESCIRKQRPDPEEAPSPSRSGPIGTAASPPPPFRSRVHRQACLLPTNTLPVNPPVAALTSRLLLLPVPRVRAAADTIPSPVRSSPNLGTERTTHARRPKQTSQGS